MAFKTSFAPTGTNLPSNLPYSKQLLADPNLSSWFQPEPSLVTLGATGIIKIVDKVASSRIFVQNNGSSYQPALTPAALNGFSGITFAGGQFLYFTATAGGTDFNLAASFSLAFLIVPQAGGTDYEQIFAKFGTASLTLAFTNATTLQAQHAGGTVTATVQRDGTPKFIVVEYDASLQRIRMRVNGVNTSAVAATSAPSGGTSALGALYPSNPNSQFLHAVAGDMFHWTVPVISTYTAGLDLMEQYVTKTYRITSFVPY